MIKLQFPEITTKSVEAPSLLVEMKEGPVERSFRDTLESAIQAGRKDDYAEKGNVDRREKSSLEKERTRATENVRRNEQVREPGKKDSSESRETDSHGEASVKSLIEESARRAMNDKREKETRELSEIHSAGSRIDSENDTNRITDDIDKGDILRFLSDLIQQLQKNLESGQAKGADKAAESETSALMEKASLLLKELSRQFDASGKGTSESTAAGREMQKKLAEIHDLLARIEARGKETGSEDMRKVASRIRELLDDMAAREKDPVRLSRERSRLADAGQSTGLTGREKGEAAPRNENAQTALLREMEQLGNMVRQMTEKGGGEKSYGDENRQGFNDSFMKQVQSLRRQSAAMNTGRARENFREQMQQLLDRAKVSVRDNRNASFSVRLYPRELGRMNLSLGLEQGVINGRFLVESGQARDLLLQNLDLIRQQLEESGVTVGEFEVNVNENSERFPGEHREEAIHGLTQDTALEASDSFDLNSQAYHDGSINLVI